MIETRPIVRLDKSGGPPTIAGLIAFRTVDSVESPILRAWSESGDESLEGTSPLLAHGDARATIEGITLVLGVVTPLFGVLPGSVFSGYRSTTGLAMAEIPCDGLLSLEASTTPSLTEFEASATSDDSFPTVALTEPAHAFGKALPGWVDTDNGEASESVSGFVVVHWTRVGHSILESQA